MSPSISCADPDTHPCSPWLTCAQGGITLRPEQGEVDTDFRYLGNGTEIFLADKIDYVPASPPL